MDQGARVSVVIVTYQSDQLLKRCLESLASQAHFLREVIVVVNSSSPETIRLIKEVWPKARVLENRENSGAAGAREQGIRAAGGEWILTLDSDAFLEEDFLEKFYAVGEAERISPRAGMIVPLIMDEAGERVYTLGHGLTFLRRFYDIRTVSALSLREVFGACSAAALYRKTALDELEVSDGYSFDRDFFFMAEDVDLAWRLRKRGWKCQVFSELKARHKGDGSGTGAHKKKFYSIRNRFFLLRKNETGLYLAVFLFPFLIYEISRFVFLCVCGQGEIYRSALISAFHSREGR